VCHARRVQVAGERRVPHGVRERSDQRMPRCRLALARFLATCLARRAV
jgi:hypothetical protein